MSRITDQDRAIYKIMKGRELCDSDFKTSWSIHSLKLEIWRYVSIMIDRLLFIEIRKKFLKEDKDSSPIRPDRNSYKGMEVFSSSLIRNNAMLKRYKDKWYIDIEDDNPLELDNTMNDLDSLEEDGFIKIVKKSKFDLHSINRWHIEFDINKFDNYRNYCKLVLEEI